MKRIICYTTGVSTGNPGPGAIGVYITDEMGVMLQEEAQTIGNTTNIFAAYYSVMAGLQTLRTMFGDKTSLLEIEMRLDSELVKKQLNAEVQITEPGLVPMFIEIHNMRVASFPHLKVVLIASEENQEAERLVKEALDAHH